MTLTLRIENYRSLEGGSPIEVTSTGRPLRIGRANGMDWVLPDPTRFISSHHFDVDMRDGAWWLTDRSTNGTFLVGQPYRLDGPYRLQQGDRFQVGQYFVIVLLGVAPTAQAYGAAPAPAFGGPAVYQPPAAGDFSDPWSVGSPVVAPVDPMPRSDYQRTSDFGDEFIAAPSIRPASPQMPPPPMIQPVPEPNPVWTTPPTPLQHGPGEGFAGAPAPVAHPVTPPPSAPAAVVAQPPLVLAAAPGAAIASKPDDLSGQAFLRAFCEGAGVSTDTAGKLSPTDFARELGRTMRVVTTEMMALLQDRATTKRFTKGGDRTMIGAKNNNPLKFLPDAKQALEVMFLVPRDGFLKGGDSVVAGMADIRRHQMAVFAAIQPALIKLLSDLAPESIDDGSGGGGLLGGGANKKKAWDTFVERWDSKAGAHENGMLDVFLQHFAESYAAAVAAANKDTGTVD
jgi:type VI secretion system protein ImpI